MWRSHASLEATTLQSDNERKQKRERETDIEWLKEGRWLGKRWNGKEGERGNENR